MNKEKYILIRQPFNDQYTLTIDMEVKMIESFMTSTTILRHDFTVISCNESEFECRLVLLDIHLVKSNNDLIKEVAQLTTAFNRMFSELHLKLSQNGEILDILNLKLILSKWEQTKLEMQEAVSTNEELKKLIASNDALFTDKEKLKTAIQANEFIQHYFGLVYNVKMPNTKKTVGTNFFTTANLEWINESNFTINSTPNNERIAKVTSKILPNLPLSSGFYNAAYHQFKDKILIHPDNVFLSQEEIRFINLESGQLNNSVIVKSEIVYPEKLYYQIKFSMISDSQEKVFEKEN